jgi:hypothetical protein
MGSVWLSQLIEIATAFLEMLTIRQNLTFPMCERERALGWISDVICKKFVNPAFWKLCSDKY